MRYFHHRRFQQQFRFLRHQFLQDGDLPFSNILSDVARQTGSALDTNAKEEWLWKRRRVLAYDGSTVSMPDTPENQQAYPQPLQQKPGVGFPLARIAAFFFSLVRSSG